MRLFSAIFCLFFLSALSAQPGALDPSFGGGGVVSNAIGLGDDVAQSVLIQPDGKIILAGYATIDASSDFALIRYNADGTLDHTFSGDGKLTTAFLSGDDRVAAAVLQPDGKIVVAGYSTDSQESDFAVARYLPDGTLDNTFSGDGKLTTNIGGLFDKAFAIALQPDKKILVAGTFGKNTESDFAVVRYNTDGVRDNLFGLNGIATLSLGSSYDEVRAMALQPDGKIILAGFTKSVSNYNIALVRFDANGSPDTGFGTNGKVITPIDNSALNYARGVAVQPDGKILVAGYTALSNLKYDFALLRYLPQGSLDPAFNGTGIAVNPVGDSYDEALALALQPNGKIITCGYSYQGGAPDFALLQYGQDGTVDSTFGVNGVVITPVGSGSDQAFSIGFGPDGKIAVAGETNNGANLDFAAARYFSGQMLGAFNPDNPLSGLSLAPNPLVTEGVLSYLLAEDAILSLELYDLQGNLEQVFFSSMKRGKGLQQEKLRFDQNLPAGVHVLVLQGRGSFQALRVVKD